MDIVEIFLLGVVGFSVIVFLILDNLHSLEKSKSTFNDAEHRLVDYDSHDKAETASFIDNPEETIDDQEEGEFVGAYGVEEKSVLENFVKKGYQEIEEQENKTEDLVQESREKSGLFSGVSGFSEGEDEIVDDWEGIERTELERRFGEAVVFVSCNGDQFDGDVMLELYGLQKVALEGPCHESQPMALKVSARSKWNAWQKLGNMSQEMSMEKYIDILSTIIPLWKGEAAEGGIPEEQSSTRKLDGIES